MPGDMEPLSALPNRLHQDNNCIMHTSVIYRDLPGGPSKVKFADEISSHSLCGKCGMISMSMYRDPNGHMVCEACLLAQIDQCGKVHIHCKYGEKTIALYCHGGEQLMESAIDLLTILRDQYVDCPNFKKCGEQVHFGDLKAHYIICQPEVKCPTCGNDVRSSDWDGHLSSCPNKGGHGLSTKKTPIQQTRRRHTSPSPSGRGGPISMNKARLQTGSPSVNTQCTAHDVEEVKTNANFTQPQQMGSRERDALLTNQKAFILQQNRRIQTSLPSLGPGGHTSMNKPRLQTGSPAVNNQCTGYDIQQLKTNASFAQPQQMGPSERDALLMNQTPRPEQSAAANYQTCRLCERNVNHHRMLRHMEICMMRERLGLNPHTEKSAHTKQPEKTEAPTPVHKKMNLEGDPPNKSNKKEMNGEKGGGVLLEQRHSVRTHQSSVSKSIILVHSTAQNESTRKDAHRESTNVVVTQPQRVQRKAVSTQPLKSPGLPQWDSGAHGAYYDELSPIIPSIQNPSSGARDQRPQTGDGCCQKCCDECCKCCNECCDECCQCCNKCCDECGQCCQECSEKDCEKCCYDCCLCLGDTCVLGGWLFCKLIPCILCCCAGNC